MSHIMVDLETLGTKPGCAIASIGACVFNQAGVQDKLYIPINIETSPLKAEMGTIKWWMGNSDAARSVFSDGRAEHHPSALRQFAGWWKSVAGRFVWCHGAPFDAPILEAAFEQQGLPAPWKFWDIRDTRTVFHLTGFGPDRATGTHHNALDDAVAQAEATIRALNKLGWPA